MSPWPFVIAAYLVTLLGAAGLALGSLAAMRRAEAQAASLGREREA